MNLLLLCLFLADPTGGSVRDFVHIKPSHVAVVYGTEPLLTFEKGPFTVSLGGFLRVETQRSAQSQQGGFTVQSHLYNEGEIFPLLRLRYALELVLPFSDGETLSLRRGKISMELASTPLLGEIHLGVMPLAFSLDMAGAFKSLKILFATNVGSFSGRKIRFSPNNFFCS